MKRNDLQSNWYCKDCGESNKDKAAVSRGIFYTYCRYCSRFRNLESSLARLIPLNSNRWDVRLMYMSCPKGMQVDHIKPIKLYGEHIVGNLQYLTPQENKIKKDKWCEANTLKYDIKHQLKVTGKSREQIVLGWLKHNDLTYV